MSSLQQSDGLVRGSGAQGTVPRNEAERVDVGPLAVHYRGRLRRLSRLGDFLELTKPRITLMVVLTTAAGFVLAGEEGLRLGLFLPTLLGTWLLAGGASVLNMVAEREADGRMERTARRPLPAGRLEAEPALVFGIALSMVGLSALFWLVNPLTAALGGFTLLAYVLVYTPLKRVTPLSTLIGAVPGAVPPLIGWCANRNSLDAGSWVLFAILFFWQLPHFFAIAWMYREDYARGGFAMLPVVESDGSRTAAQTVIFTVALLAASLLPAPLGISGLVYGTVALGLGVWFVVFAVRFARTRSRATARRLMLYSVLYLPVVLASLVLDRVH